MSTESLRSAMKAAMKQQDKTRLSVIRSLLSAIQYEEMRQDKQELDESAINLVLKNELKKREEALEFARTGQRTDLVKDLEDEKKIIEEFLPQQLAESELRTILGKLKEEQPSAKLGDAMKYLKENYSGQYDGKQASSIAREIFG